MDRDGGEGIEGGRRQRQRWMKASFEEVDGDKAGGPPTSLP